MASTDPTLKPAVQSAGYMGETAYAWHGKDSAPVMVFIHGVGMNQSVWDAQVADFAPDYAVITYDLLGHGDSGLPPEPTRLANLCAQLLRLLDDLAIDSARIVGHSMGALVATEFALRHPGRVDYLIALNAVYRRSAEQRRSVLQRAGEIAAGGLSSGNSEAVERWFTTTEKTTSPERIERIRRWLNSVSATGYARIYRAFATSDDAFIGRLVGLSVPALFMTGSEDPNSTPAMSRQLAAEAGNARAAIIADERHMMAYISPDVVNRRIRAFIEASELYTSLMHGPD